MSSCSSEKTNTSESKVVPHNRQTSELEVECTASTEIYKLSLEDNCIVIRNASDAREFLRFSEFKHASLTRERVLKIDNVVIEQVDLIIVPSNEIPIDSRQLLFFNFGNEIIIKNAQKIQSVEINTETFPVVKTENFEGGDQICMKIDSLEVLKQNVNVTLDAMWRRNTKYFKHSVSFSFK